MRDLDARAAQSNLLCSAGHFRNEHFACDHPHCLEARFVVFANEQELKQHRLREHNEQLSRNERRAALQIPVNLTVCSLRALSRAPHLGWGQLC